MLTPSPVQYHARSDTRSFTELNVLVSRHLLTLDEYMNFIRRIYAEYTTSPLHPPSLGFEISNRNYPQQNLMSC